MSESDKETVPEFQLQQLQAELTARSAFVNLLAELHETIHFEHPNIDRIQGLLFQLGESWALRSAVDPHWNESAPYTTQSELDCIQTLLTIARYTYPRMSGSAIVQNDNVDVFAELSETFFRIANGMRIIAPEMKNQASESEICSIQ